MPPATWMSVKICQSCNQILSVTFLWNIVCKPVSVVFLSRASYLLNVLNFWLVYTTCHKYKMYRAIDEQHSAIGRSLSLDQPSGIRFWTSSEKRLKTLSGCHRKRRFSDNISVFSALEDFYDNVLYKLTFYLLTLFCLLVPV